MTLATDITRDGCTLGHKVITYATLSRDYRCNDCGGCIALKWSDDEKWYPECAKCGGRDFIHQAQAERNKQLVREMFEHLPEAIVQSYMERRTEQCQS